MITAYMMVASVFTNGTVGIVLLIAVALLWLAAVIWLKSKPRNLFRHYDMWLTFDKVEYFRAGRMYTYKCWRQNFVGWWVDDGTIMSSTELEREP